MPEQIPVLTASESKALDQQAIVGLPDSFTLMHRAAEAAVQWLDLRDERSAAVYVGPGNNGGDGWVIAGLLRRLGWNVSVCMPEEPRTPDAQRARAGAEADGAFTVPTGSEALVIDALLGTGASGAFRGDIAESVTAMRHANRPVIAIDIPSGLDATTGEDAGAVPAQCTLTFGSVKRGQLLRRDLVGALVVLDIGLPAAPVGTPHMMHGALLDAWLPHLRPTAWKGTRGRVAIVGGDAGMAGAVILAARAAHASGAGMVRADVDAASATALQVAAPFATVGTWSAHAPTSGAGQWADAMVIGPGLDGTRASVRAAVVRLLHAYDGPVVLDAGALTAFARREVDAVHDGDDSHDADGNAVQQLRHALHGRPALLTPHIGEFTRMFPAGAAPADRFTAASVLARALHATVLLKGVPTVVAAPDGTSFVSAAGNVALAVGGSGDVLSGVAGALLAQGLAPAQAGACAAHVHGCAAERAVQRHEGRWRGVTIDALLAELAHTWPGIASDAAPWPPRPNVLMHLDPVPFK